MRNLVLFTNTYPTDGAERSFLKEELKYVCLEFDKVHVVPMFYQGKEMFDLPKNAQLQLELSYRLQNPELSQKLKGLFSKTLLTEIWRSRLNYRKMRLGLGKNISSIVVSGWLSDFLNQASEERTVLYSFWMNECAYGALRYKKLGGNVKLVSRCHNYDLYGNEENGHYVPFQKEIVQNFDLICPVSVDGANYLNNLYQTRIEPAIMGVPRALSINSGSKDETLRFVSCSHMVTRKRIDLIYEGIKTFCVEQPRIRVQWTHIGNGPEMVRIKKMIEDGPKNLTVELTGALHNEEVHRYYANEPVDLFINASAKEGTPVSIMEAISYGIPVLATAFGGNKEVIEKGAGFLMPIDPTESDFSEALNQFLRSEKDQLREIVIAVWKKHYNSDYNYAAFTAKIYQLLK